MADHIIKTLFKTLKERKNFDTDKSYTAQLLNNPNLLAKKIGEESTELIIDLVNNNKTRGNKRVCRFIISFISFLGVLRHRP